MGKEGLIDYDIHKKMEIRHRLRFEAYKDRIERLETILIEWERAGAEIRKCTLYGPADSARELVDKAFILTREYQKQFME